MSPRRVGSRSHDPVKVSKKIKNNNNKSLWCCKHGGGLMLFKVIQDVEVKLIVQL